MIRLLIIDDNSAFLNAARELLLRHRSGFAVDTALDAESAGLAIRRCHYDVVVSDIRLPGIQGLEVLAECRRIRPDASVIMVTGYGDRELEAQAAKLGAYAFLHKPVAIEAFCAAVDRAVLHSKSGRSRDNAPRPDHRWYVQAAKHIHRRSEAITAQLIRPLTQTDAEVTGGWADKQAERIIDTFLGYEGPDDLLRLKDDIEQALCRAYRSGKLSASIHRYSREMDISPDIKP